MKYEQKTLILDYFGQKWPILDHFRPKRANLEFSAKKQNCHFFTVTKPGLHEKNQKNLMRGFLGKVRTMVPAAPNDKMTKKVENMLD